MSFDIATEVELDKDVTRPPTPAAGNHDPEAALATVVSTFEKWLYMPDPMPLFAVLGTIAANRMPGDPVWMLLIGPPGGGKTELLQPLAKLPHVHMASTLTEASLLSATPSRDNCM